MKPENLCKNGTEHGHQSALICWTELPETKLNYPDARKIFAINNNAGMGDGKKGAMRGMRAKQAGVKAGVPDLFLPVGNQWANGLFVEMKRPDLKPVRRGAGGVSDAQNAFLRTARKDGYGALVCYGWEEAAESIRDYLDEK